MMLNEAMAVSEGMSIDKYVTALVQSGAVKVATDPEHPYELRNGDPSVVYVDHGQLLCHPETFQPFVGALAEYVLDQFPGPSTILVNVDSKSSPHMVGALASLLHLRLVVVNPESTKQAERGLNLGVRLPMQVSPTDRLLFVDDVFTEKDETVANAATLVREAFVPRLGNTLETHLLVGLLRGNTEASVRQLRLHGIMLHWLVTLDEIIEKARPTLTDQQLGTLDQGWLSLARRGD